MSNITPKTPSHTFGYWRPWKDNSNMFDSYLDYSKDVSLTKYGADTVGKYINQASKQQVQAINKLGQAVGRGMNVLSNQMTDVNDTLGFLNRNMDIQIEQQKLSNLLLQNIVELLRVPDSEKERQHSIELGIKFFVNANKDSDLYADALEELLKAESLMKQDYFVLHRIGCIYLYVEKYINPEKAFEYFVRAAKYASVESDSKAMRLVNVLRGKLTLYKLIGYENDLNDKIQLDEETISKTKKLMASNPGPFLKTLREDNKTKEWYDETMKESEEKIEEMKKMRTILVNSNKNGISEKQAQVISLVLLETLKIKSEIIPFIEQSEEIDISEIQYLAADSYEKAAFSAYVIGRFEDAVNYQSKALKFNSTSENRFLLSKYQVRNSNIQEAIVNLSECIDQVPTLAIAAFKELDLINEPEVIKLITEKNDAIDNKIKQLTLKWKTVESTKANEVINELTELSQKSYEIKIADFNKYEKEGNTINTGITELEAKIDSYISEIKKTVYPTFDADKIQTIIKELVLAKDLPLEKMQAAFDKLKKETDASKLKIGSKYAGGICFYLDKTENHGLVYADKKFGDAIWGCDGEIFIENGGIADGSGMANTKKIVELASYNIENVKDGWFSTKQVKTPAPTAARLCLESNHNGYNDWYLPTRAELNLIFKNPGISDDYYKTEALICISSELAKQGKIEEAASAMQEVLECARGISDDFSKMMELIDISTELAKQGKIEEAASAMQEALECAREIIKNKKENGDAIMSTALRYISTELANQGKIEEAASAMQEALACARGISDESYKSSALKDISSVLAKQGKFEEAASAMQEALECARGISNDFSKMRALKDFSGELAKQGKIEEAALVLQELIVCAYAQRISDFPSEDWALSLIASELAKQGKFEEAIVCARGFDSEKNDNFSSGNYWSSTASSFDQAWNQDLKKGNYSRRSDKYNVRAVRAF